ncbi:MAG: alpha/beta fold hydrolase [Actinomycetota bacterium]|nr:alpha/beta fold hydrolase [Actinomycetota bacterium]
MSAARIDFAHQPSGARDLVLVAHGGQDSSLEDPHDRRVALLRMWPFVAAAKQAAPQAAIGLVRYRYRGWNGSNAHAMADVCQLLDSLGPGTERVVLVGHSMGGRAVLHAAEHPLVSGVLALAPWLPRDEPLADLHGRLVVFAHGDQDRMTDPRLSVAYARRLRAADVPVSVLTVEGDAHSMLARHQDWDELVRRFVAAALDGDPVDAFFAGTTSIETARRPDPLPRWTRGGGKLRGVLSILRSRAMLAW